MDSSIFIMKKSSLTLLFCASTLMPAAYGTVSFDIEADLLQTALLGEAMPSSGTVMLLADTMGDGFGAVEAFSFTGELSSGLTTNGSGGDDLVLWVSDLTNNNIDGMLFGWASNITLGSYGDNTLSEGDALALVWFPEVSLGDGLVNVGASYGVFAQVTGSLESVWSMPADGSSAHGLYIFTENSAVLPYGEGSGLLDSSLLQADQIAVPEPATATALLGLAALGLVAGRRRSKR
jgi:MYXO-CTERM domain-containing protein